MIRYEVSDGIATITLDRPERGLRGCAEPTERWWPLVACPKPVIGAIDGVAVGMGAEFRPARFTGR